MRTVRLGRGARGAVRVARRPRPQHRLRSTRPARRRRPRRYGRAALARQGGRCATTSATRSLPRLSNRFANVLQHLGRRHAGERVFVLADRIPELYIAALGTLKHKNVFCPMFSVFGPEPIHARMSIGDARVLVTTQRLYRRKIADLRARLPGLQHVLVVTDDSAEALDAGMPRSCVALLDTRRAIDSKFRRRDPQDMALLHFTSGTTGQTEGRSTRPRSGRDAPCDGPLRARSARGRRVLVHGRSGLGDRHVVRHRRAALYRRNAAGRSAGVRCGALVSDARAGARRRLVHGADRDPDVDEAGRSAGAPLRLRARCDSSRASANRCTPKASCGVRRAFGLPIHDNYWQTETGGIVIANFRAMDVKPGSMGRPLPGIEAAIVERDARRAACG